MSDDEFFGWVELHCVATGATPDTARTISANQATFRKWSATVGELGECTDRLVSNLRAPKFANEHVEAVGRELRALRHERAEARAAAEPQTPGPAPAPTCELCGDSGFVEVPMPQCVEVRPDAPARLIHAPGYHVVLTFLARCDHNACAAGAKLYRGGGKVSPPALSKYRRKFRGADVVQLLRDHQQAETERLRGGAGSESLRDMPNIAKRLAANGFTAPRKAK